MTTSRFSPMDYAIDPTTSGSHVCVGDSAGPILEQVGSQDVVVGLVSYGDEACTQSYAARVDRLRTFIESVVPPSAAPVDVSDLAPVANVYMSNTTDMPTD